MTDLDLNERLAYIRQLYDDGHAYIELPVLDGIDILERCIQAEHNLRYTQSVALKAIEDRNIAQAAVASVRSLMQNSAGVYGLHMNGDLAPWEELTSGGQCEGWLSSLDKVPDTRKGKSND